MSARIVIEVSGGTIRKVWFRPSNNLAALNRAEVVIADPYSDEEQDISAMQRLIQETEADESMMSVYP